MTMNRRSFLKTPIAAAVATALPGLAAAAVAETPSPLFSFSAQLLPLDPGKYIVSCGVRVGYGNYERISAVLSPGESARIGNHELSLASDSATFRHDEDLITISDMQVERVPQQYPILNHVHRV